MHALTKSMSPERSEVQKMKLVELKCCSSILAQGFTLHNGLEYWSPPPPPKPSHSDSCKLMKLHPYLYASVSLHNSNGTEFVIDPFQLWGTKIHHFVSFASLSSSLFS